MKPKERIPIFLNLLNWEKLSKRWDLPKNLESFLKGHLKQDNLLEYWQDNPDQRFGQMLINQGILQDNLRIWIDEEIDILKDQGINPRDFLLWGSTYDKDKNLLDEVKYRLIKDLETNHIENILKDFERSKAKLSPLFQETFEKELEMRKGKPKIVKVDPYEETITITSYKEIDQQEPIIE